MSSPNKDAVELLKNQVNLLIVDDDTFLRESLVELLTSPIVTISAVASLDDAIKTIGASPHHWHCWILDVDLGRGKSGLELLSRYPQFPFALVLSGLHSMTVAAEAMKLGARSVFDKEPSSLERLYDHVCKTAALGYLMGGKPSPQFNTFLLLQDPAVTTIEEWASRAFVPLRQLHRTCELHPPLTPHYALMLYRAVYYLLRGMSGATPSDSSASEFPHLTDQAMLYESCIEYIVHKHKSQK